MKARCLLMRVFLTLNLVGWTLLLGVSTAEAAPSQQGGITYHTVRRGETLAGIAARYGTTVRAIAQRNNIANPNRIYVGQRLAIFAASVASAPPASPPSVSSSTHCAYRIVWGDTLSKIAAQYGTTTQWLMSANGLSSSRIIAGRMLRVPCSGRQKTTVSPSPAPGASKGVSRVSYRVRPGDTLSGIALLYRTTVRAIMDANGLRNPHHIYAGQVLQIPRH